MLLEFYATDIRLSPTEEKAIYKDYRDTMRLLGLPAEQPEFNQESVVSHMLYFTDLFGKPSQITRAVIDRAAGGGR